MELLSGIYIKNPEGLKSYRYHGIDGSLVAKYIMQPFWTRAVNLLPLWMA
jgi:ethanolaminephosphotransferase